MSGSDTLQLLSILRGTAPAPQPPPGVAAPAAAGPRSGAEAASTAGLHRQPSTSSLSLYQTALPTPVSALVPTSAQSRETLMALFTRPHPSANSSQQALYSAPPASGAVEEREQQPFRPPHAPVTRRSSDLLSLFRGSPSPSDSVSAQAARSLLDAESVGRDNKPSSPTSPPGGNARQLLGLLMGGGSTDGTRTAEQSMSMGTARAPPASIPAHVRAFSPTSGRDASEAATAVPPRVNVATTDPAVVEGPITHEYLAAQYLPTDILPHWVDSQSARPGLRLPRSAHPPHETQHLTISLGDAHQESLARSLPPTTPVTLLSLPAAFTGARRTAGIWEHGFVYATGGGKGRVRVIDRESGARILLKGGKGGDIVELRVAPYTVGGKRIIVTISEEGVGVVWEVADSFGSEEQAHARKLCDLTLPAAPVLVRFHPDPSSQSLAIVCEDSKLRFVKIKDSDRGGYEIPLRSAIVDVTYSADGSLFAILLRSGKYWLFSSSTYKQLRAGMVPLKSDAEPDQLVLIEPADVNKRDDQLPLLAVSSGRGTCITLVDVDHDAEPSTIKYTVPQGVPDMWGHLAYHRPTQSLLVSHSLRGSVYSFHLAFPISSAQRVRIESVLEQPTPDPVISFILDESPSVAAISTEENGPGAPASRESSGPAPWLSFGALLQHPRGISHIGLTGCVPQPSRSATPSIAGTDDDEPSLAALAAGRRMSLEGSIYVASEVSVRVDEPETDDLSLKVAIPPVSADNATPSSEIQSANSSTQDVIRASSTADEEPALGDLGNGLSGARSPIAEVLSSEYRPTNGIRFAGPISDAATRDLTARLPSHPQQTVAAGSFLSPIASAPASVSSENGYASESEGREESLGGVDGEAVAREMRRLESGLASKVSKVVPQELDTHIAHLERHSTSLAAASTAREVALIATMQQTIATGVARATETVLAERIGGLVERAVRTQVGRGVEEAIARALPLELEKQLSRPALTNVLSSSMAAAMAPPLEQHLTGSLVRLLVPAVEQKVTHAVDSVISSMRTEIVQEQSVAARALEREVASLREEVSSLKDMVAQMHSLALRHSEPRPADAKVSRRVPQPPPSLSGQSQLHSQPQGQYQQQSHVSQPFDGPAPSVTNPLRRSLPVSSSDTVPVAMHALPPIPRAATPLERYEELFTEAMQPQHAPAFVSLQHLVASSPLSRIDAVFPPPPALPKISMAVVLSLAYRLSQIAAERQGPLDDEGKKQLLWLRKAIAACDGKQPPDLLALIPRILTDVIDNLVLRGRALMALHDHAGANEVRLVQQYAHARLSLFSQGDAGQGFEEFRR